MEKQAVDVSYCRKMIRRSRIAGQQSVELLWQRKLNSLLSTQPRLLESADSFVHSKRLVLSRLAFYVMMSLMIGMICVMLIVLYTTGAPQ